MWNKFFQVIGTVFLLGIAPSYAQAPEYAIEHLTIDQGLPQNEVTSIIQDRKGFIWFGTRGGLARYDGSSMKVFQYEPGVANSLSNNSIETLFEASDGKIWIGTKSGGLNCFDPILEELRQYQFHSKDSESLSGDGVVSIAETQDRKIWVGTDGEGLNWLDPATGKFHRLLPGCHILALSCTKDGTLWASADNSLYKIEKGTQLPVDVQLDLPENVMLSAIKPDEVNDQLYISGWKTGVIIYNFRRQKIVNQIDWSHPGKPNPVDDIYSILKPNSSNMLWMGTWGDGLKYLDRGGKVHSVFIAPDVRAKYNTDFDIILDIFEDRSGNIWIGTDGGGVCKLTVQKKFFKSFTFKNSELSSGHVLSLIEGRDGRVWIGTRGGGLNELKGNKIIHHKEIFEKINDIRVNDIHSLYEDVNGDILFGSNYGLHKITGIVNDKISFETITNDPRRKTSLSDEKVTAILRDGKGRLWVGTQRNGLNRLTDIGVNGETSFNHYRYDPHNTFSLAANRISALFEDSKGRLWVGTYKGLHLYKPDIDGFVRISYDARGKGGLSNDIVTCIKEDLHGNIWVGTAGGLNKVTVSNDAPKVSYLTRKDGLPNDYINSIIVDPKNNLWIGSAGGLFKFDINSHQIQLFNLSDGLQSNAFSENAACTGKNGLIYFGGINGFNVFDPMQKLVNVPSPLSFIVLKIMNQEVEPGQMVHGRKILDRSITYTDEITLSYLDKVFSVEVSSMDFSMPEKNYYAYKLEGFDKEWANLKNTRTVTYTNLAPGSYALLVKAGDMGNIWVGEPIRLHITVLPPPWRTWWAYMLYACAAFLLALIIRRNVKKEMRLKEDLQKANLMSTKAGLEKMKEREVSEMKFRFFTNVSHELKTPLTLIIGPLEELLVLNDVSKNIREKLLLIHRHSGRLLMLINQLLDLRKAESGNMRLQTGQRDMVRFAFEVFEGFNDLADRRNIAYSYHSDIDNLLIDFDENKIEMAMTNILSNAFKNTPDFGKIICSLTIERDNELNKSFCTISIEDTGRGMPPQVLDKIFDLYYQVAVVDSVKISGTGIGLSLVREIMQLHGGLVAVKSTEGKGSRFSIKLPLKNVSGNASSNLNQPSGQSLDLMVNDALEDDKPLVLIIEDTDELRDYLIELLHDEFNVLEAANGEEGFKLSMDRLPDIIVSDVMMDKMDGFELCYKVKNNVATSHIPVILLTAKNMPESELSGLDAGADDYIKKPFNPILLVARIRRLLESRKKLKEYYGKKVTLQPTNVEITPFDEKFLQKAMTYIEANLLNPELTTESLGYELGMSHSRLYRKLKALTGLTIQEFIRSIRIKRAAQLLETGEYNVSEAAVQTGFSEMKYFRNYFKEQFGCLPSEYFKVNPDKASKP